MASQENANASDGFDFIVVGSGAGGGPLAARLASRGKRVLVLEAGSDHTKEPQGDRTPAMEVSLVPLLHAVSTEHKDLAWRFFVDHYDNPPAGVDPKWHQGSRADGQDTGIFYPRASAIGGCTIHNALITIAGPDSDWNQLADFLHDPSWTGQRMRPYFQRLERCEYLDRPAPPPASFLGRTWDNLRFLFGYEPDYRRGRHGFDGWLHTSFVDINLAFKDLQLLKMLRGALIAAQKAGIESALTLLRSFQRNQINEHLDPNHARTQAESPEGLVIVPLAVCGKRTTVTQDASMPYVQRGRRSSPRDLLLATRIAHPDNLEIWTDCLVTKILFDESSENRDSPFRAIGVQYLRGKNLYHAHYRPSEDPGELHTVFVKPGGEIILCGGSFNTPQILMLSGIGDEAHLSEIAGGAPDACVMHGRNGEPLASKDSRRRRHHLPGVGENLQDRYEVTLISQMKHDFELLDGSTIELPDTAGPDLHLREWRESGTGLCASNGAVLGIFKRSRPDLDQPDLFIFGVPAPFEGYAVGYSKVGHIHDHFTWAILKGHSRNHSGLVRLRNADPRATPKINFHYFNEPTRKRDDPDDPDLLALVDGVKFVRSIFENAQGVVSREKHPGFVEVPADDDEAIKKWIQRVAWGHHACGTCRMGPPGDEHAVLDSRFRVRGIDGLRVVDASIFPTIPGYFIVTSVYMASEKAADVIFEDGANLPPSSPIYPRELAQLESDAIKTRRQKLDGAAPAATTRIGDWAEDVTGLGISGGGVRSATLNLGVLQAFAKSHWLQRIDLLSTVSGGGYIGSFVGRFFDRKREASLGTGEHACKPQEIESELADPDAREVAWLRKHSNYLAPAGSSDARLNTAIFIRGFLSIHFVIGAVIFAWFCLANLLRYGVFDKLFALLGFVTVSKTDMPIGHLIESLFGPFFSPWFICCELILLFLVLPRLIGFWLVSQDHRERFQEITLVLLFLSSGVLLYLSVADGFALESFMLALALLTTFIHVELAWRRGRIQEAASGSGGIDTQRWRTRSILTFDLGLSLALAGLALAFAVVDTLGHGLHQWLIENNISYAAGFASLGGGLVALMPIARFLATNLAKFEGDRATASFVRKMTRSVINVVMTFILILTPTVFFSFAAHAAYFGGSNIAVGIGVTVLAWIISIILRHPLALSFVNRSSLAQSYSSRLACAYLGASNPVRHTPAGSNVTEVVAGDDVGSIRDYRPHEGGGPLHLINVTVNQTVDFTSQRGNRDRQGDNVAVSCLGMSVGAQFHSEWKDSQGGLNGDPLEVPPATLTPVGHIPGTEHPMLDASDRPPAKVETLSLREWMGISGAAIAPGRGQDTTTGASLLFGLANLRTGHWWDSGISKAGRDGFAKLSFLRRFYYLFPRFFLAQSLLLREWVARYPGPWSRFWYLSDGGFFENLAGYELIRRQLPRIVLCDAGADPLYEFEDFANLVRKVRIDFDAEIVPFTPDELTRHVPEDLKDIVGSLAQLKPRFGVDGKLAQPAERHAALFWVKYGPTSAARSVMLFIKATLPTAQTADIENYQATHPEFPHESTADQFFHETQWESYRQLGEVLASPLAKGDWFWKIPLH